MSITDGKNKLIIVIILSFLIKFIIDSNTCICTIVSKVEEKKCFVYYSREREINAFDDLHIDCLQMQKISIHTIQWRQTVNGIMNRLRKVLKYVKKLGNSSRAKCMPLILSETLCLFLSSKIIIYMHIHTPTCAHICIFSIMHI